MATLASIGIKQQDGSYKNYTISIGEKLDKFGNNVSMYVEQTKEERDNKTPKKYVGNGKVIWNDGIIMNAKELKKNETPSPTPEPATQIDYDLPF